jgi:hypothetical protein
MDEVFMATGMVGRIVISGVSVVHRSWLSGKF